MLSSVLDINSQTCVQKIHKKWVNFKSISLHCINFIRWRSSKSKRSNIFHALIGLVWDYGSWWILVQLPYCAFDAIDVHWSGIGKIPNVKSITSIMQPQPSFSHNSKPLPVESWKNPHKIHTLLRYEEMATLLWPLQLGLIIFFTIR